MARSLRRVVTDRDEAGKSFVVSDGPAPTAAPGVRQVVLWAADAMPAPARGAAEVDAATYPLQPAPNATKLLFFEVQPEDESVSSEDQERMAAEMFERMGAADSRGDTTRHPFMHTTQTLDYVVLLSGQVTLLLDEGEVTLNPFDSVVQQTTNHAWVNRGDEPALLVAVMIGA